MLTAGAQLSSATIGLACYLVSNAIVVSTMTCAAHSARRAIYWLAFVRWSCWNTTFLVTTIKVCSACLRRAARRRRLANGLTAWRVLMHKQLSFTSRTITEGLKRCMQVALQAVSRFTF